MVERRRNTTWASFIRQHRDVLWATDFFTTEIGTRWGLATYYVLFFIHVRSRRIVLGEMSQNPNEGWMKQTARNVTSSDGPLVGARYLIHDRDAKYTQSFDQILKAAGTAVIRLPPQSPNLNAFAERFVKTIKTECLEQFVLFGEESLRHVIREYLAHYHAERNHQGIKNVIPFPDRRLEAREGRIEKAEWLGWAAELLPPPGRLPKFKVRLCDPSVISRLRRFVSRHTGLDAPDDIAEPKRRFVPVVLVWLVESRAPTSDEYVDLTGSTAT